MATLTGPPAPDGKPTRRVLVGRHYGENMEVYEHPLVIDPDRLATDVLADRVWACPSQAQCATSGGAVYFVEPMLYPDKRRHLVKIGFPGTAKEIIAKGLAPCELENRVVIHDGRVHAALEQLEIVTKNIDRTPKTTSRTTIHFQWWTISLDGKELRQVATRLPPIKSLGVSAHYGLVAWVGETNGPMTLNGVEFPAAKSK